MIYEISAPSEGVPISRRALIAKSVAACLALAGCEQRATTSKLLQEGGTTVKPEDLRDDTDKVQVFRKRAEQGTLGIERIVLPSIRETNNGSIVFRTYANPFAGLRTSRPIETFWIVSMEWERGGWKIGTPRRLVEAQPPPRLSGSRVVNRD